MRLNYEEQRKSFNFPSPPLPKLFGGSDEPVPQNEGRQRRLVETEVRYVALVPADDPSATGRITSIDGVPIPAAVSAGSSGASFPLGPTPLEAAVTVANSLKDALVESDECEQCGQPFPTELLTALDDGTLLCEDCLKISDEMVLRELEKEGWQPIETAPRDGTVIELLIDDEAVIGRWIYDRRCMAPSPNNCCGDGWACDDSVLPITDRDNSNALAWRPVQ